MKNVILIILLLTASESFSVCHKCEIIREKNKHLPPPEYEFYDDYLKAHKNEPTPEKEAEASKQTPAQKGAEKKNKQ